jgi:uncharacterized protein YlzI (FlbEa/FlbD family)
MTRKTVVDVIIGNKEQCAVNTYLVEAVACLPEEVKTLIEYREWSVVEEEGRNKKKELKAKVIPSLAINGKLCFEGVLPSIEELEEVIRGQFQRSEAK